jgi:hypothetical protein
MDFATKQHPIIEAWFSEGAAWEDVVGFWDMMTALAVFWRTRTLEENPGVLCNATFISLSIVFGEEQHL